MNKKMKGTPITEILYQDLAAFLSTKDQIPNVVDISIGDDYGSELYAKRKEKTITSKASIEFHSIHFPKKAYEDLKQYIIDLNQDQTITGIMLQLPLPANLKDYERDLLDTITPAKDIDGLTSTSAGYLSNGTNCLVPCTPQGIIALLKAYNIDLNGKLVAIINRSNIIGKPLAQLLLQENATPIICHSKTANLKQITKSCDIVITAISQPEYFDSSYFKEGAVIIDAGVNKLSGKIVGDVDYQDVYNKASLITPPTGAVGPMTICMLAYNATKCLYPEEVDTLLIKSINKTKKLTRD